MASAKSSSRTRAAHPSSQSKATANKLEENLNVFKSDHFDADGYVQTKCNSLNEKVVSSFLFFFFSPNFSSLVLCFGLFKSGLETLALTFTKNSSSSLVD